MLSLNAKVPVGYNCWVYVLVWFQAKKDCLCGWDKHESSGLLLSLILAGDFPAAAEWATGTALLEALLKAHQACGLSHTRHCSSSQQEVYIHSHSCNPAGPQEYRKCNFGFHWLLELNTIESTTVECQCVPQWPSIQMPFSDIIGTSMALTGQSSEQWHKNRAFIFCQFRGVV